MARVLVTGGAGFIASHVADALIAKGHTVAIVDNLVTGFKENVNPKAIFYEADIRDAGRMAEIFDEFKPEYVDHHAAQMDVRKSTVDPVFDAQCNILGSLNLILNARKHKINKFIYVSTGGAVYGDVKPDVLPLGEEYPVNPICQYGISKHTVEHYLFLERYLYNQQYTVLRYPNVYGPRQNPKGEAGVTAIFVGQMLRGEQPKIFGDGSKTRDYVFIADVVKANVLAIESDFNGILNIGSGKGTSDQEIFDACAAATGFKGKPVYESVRPGEVPHICLDGTKAKNVLGWAPTVSLADGIAKVFEYNRQRLRA